MEPWGSGSTAPTPRPRTDDFLQEEGEIKAAVTQMVTYANAHDLEHYLLFFWQSPDLQIVSDGAEIRGWAELKAAYERSYPNKTDLGSFSLEKIKVQHLGPGLALTLSWWTVIQPGGHRTYCTDSSIFQHFADGWKIITEHSSTFTP
ncbi:MAG TPA: hypothetical protein VGD78_19145 [Chthoniobacterales bacterium]